MTDHNTIATNMKVGMDIRNLSGANAAPCTMGTGYLPGVKRSGHGIHHPPHLSSKLKKVYSYTSTPLLGLRGLL
jgi:hypothetical protein